MALARFCTNRRCRNRLNANTRPKGRCRSCGKITLRLKYDAQVQAAEQGKLLWFGHRLVIKAS